MRLLEFPFFLDYLDKAKILREQNLEERTWFWDLPPIVESTSSVGLLQGD